MIPESKARAIAIAQACLDKKANDVLILHVASLTSIADFLVLCSGESDRQVRAIADHVHHALSKLGSNPLSIEGVSTSQWVLMDYGDVIGHIFRTDIREHYGIEKLWGDAKRVRVPARSAAPVTALQPTRKRTVRARERG
ncbi:MAG: ribosome silencing factor [Nitrospiraceae bacterium]